MIALSSLRRLTWMIWSPSRTFAEISENPTWLGVYLAISLGSAFVAWLSAPVFQKISLLALPEALSDSQIERISWINQIVRYASTATAFLVTLLSWFVSSFLLWLIVQIFEGLASFKAIFSVVAHSSVVTLISGATVITVLLIEVQDNEIEAQDLEIRMGLDLFLDEQAHPALMVVLANLNPFNLWYYGLLSLGIRTICKFNWLRSVGVVVLFWVLCMAFGAGIAWVLSALSPPTPQP